MGFRFNLCRLYFLRRIILGYLWFVEVEEDFNCELFKKYDIGRFHLELVVSVMIESNGVWFGCVADCYYLQALCAFVSSGRFFPFLFRI